MADERYHWLDQEAAERLLRGGSAEPADGPADPGAERLAAALDAVRPRAARTALPGEEAALAAFREATAARTAAPVPAPGAGEPADLGRVRLARVTVPPRRWGRSARYGLAAAVAAVAVGGVAVAGTGALPLMGPAPAASVTAGGAVRPLVSPEPGGVPEDPGTPGPRPRGDDPTPGPSGSAGAWTPAPTGPSLSPSSGAATDGGTDGGDGGDDGAAAKRDHPGPDPGTADPDGDPGRTRDRSGRTGAELREKAREACRSYLAGTLDATGRRHLTGALAAGETLRRYCDRILSSADGTPRDAPGRAPDEDGAKGGAKDGSKDGSKGGSKGGSKDDRKDGSPGGGKNTPKADGRPGDGRGASGSRGGNGRAATTPKTLASRPAPAGDTVPARPPRTV